MSFILNIWKNVADEQWLHSEMDISFWEKNDWPNIKLGQEITRSDILQGQALFRGVKQLRRCLLMLNNFEKLSFPSIEKRLTKNKETDGQKEKRQEKTKKKKRKKRNRKSDFSVSLCPFS